MIQAQTRGQVLSGVAQYGVAPGARKMMDWEEEAAQYALDTGIYGSYRNSAGQDCTRVGPSSKCFCGHLFRDHQFTSKRAPYPRCCSCSCQAFAFVPTRPEEVGDWWLVRRKGFNVHTWRAKCRCGHSHEEHDPNSKRCRCGCPVFQSNFACLACDKKWEDHETVFETLQERAAGGRPVGEDYRPLASDGEMRQHVFPGDHAAAAADSFTPSRLRPAQVSPQHAEKSVQIMHESSGGVIKARDQGVVNMWGKVEAPPREWLYMGGETGAARGHLEDSGGAGPSGAGNWSPASSAGGRAVTAGHIMGVTGTRAGAGIVTGAAAQRPGSGRMAQGGPPASGASVGLAARPAGQRAVGTAAAPARAGPAPGQKMSEYLASIRAQYDD